MMVALRSKAIRSAYGGLAPQSNHRWLVATANNGIVHGMALSVRHLNYVIRRQLSYHNPDWVNFTVFSNMPADGFQCF